MNQLLIYPIGTTDACRFAAALLKKNHIPLTDHPSPEVTHLLLDVPGFRPDGTLRSGEDAEGYLSMLPNTVTVAGGNLEQPCLAGVKKLDLLKDPFYLSSNAEITAHCALKIALPLLATTLPDTPTLIIGWGRIGKCLARLLRSVDCDVTVAARKDTDRAALRSLGYRCTDMQALPGLLPRFRLIFNTAPEMVLRQQILKSCGNCVKIDLASKPGLEGDDVVWARGLPGIHAPESSGRLIAETLIQFLKEES